MISDFSDALDLIYPDSKTLDLKILVQLSSSFSISHQGQDVAVNSIFGDKTGSLVFVIPSAAKAKCGTLLDATKRWTYSTVASLSESFTSSNLGQAFTPIDLLARDGGLLFSDSSRFSTAVTSRLRSGSIYVFCVSSS